MVKEITAYQAEDGQVFETSDAAARHDALEKLKSLGVFNHASAVAVLDHAQAIVNVLYPLCPKTIFQVEDLR